MQWNHPANLVKIRNLVFIWWTVLYFTDKLFSAFYRLFCKIANLWNIDLKFSGFISNINLDNPENFCKLSMSRSYFSKNLDIRDFARYVKYILFCAFICILTCGKNLIVIIFLVFKISGGCFQPPPHAINLSKR